MNTALASQYGRRPDPSVQRRAWSAPFRKLSAGMKALQYARMVSVMHRLSDSHLAKAGLRRSDIPEQARRSIYGDD